MNRFFTLLLAASCLTAVGQVPDYVPTEGLVGWFDMEGELLNELSGELGTLTNTSNTSDRYGNEDMAIEFSGNAYGVTSGSNMPTGALSVASWILPPTSWSQGAGIEFLCLGSSGSTKWGAIVGSEFAHLNRGRGCGGGGQVLQNPGIEFNQWNHVVFSCAGPGLATEVYLNGSLIGLSQNINPGSGCSASNLYFGVDVFSQPEYISGALDDIGIWNRAITEDEVLALYNTAAPIAGCTEEGACNYDLEAVIDDGSCLYADDCGECGGDSVSGCTDSYACNYTEEASCDDGSCDYTCCPGPGCCLDGQHWDWELNGCVITNPSDSNFDGCVQLNDLLDLLSAYGDCGAEESVWQCGDPLEYQGYGYETVQIGEQCWFAENCRYMPFVVEGVVHPTDAAIMVQGYQGDSLDEAIQLDNYINFGALYNHQATEETQLCPIGWHIPTDSEFQVLEISMGMDPSVASDTFWRGETEGAMLKSATQWNGADTNGFNALPAGTIGSVVDDQAYFWTSSAVEGTVWHRALATNRTDINRNMGNKQLGYSVRCLKNAE